MATKTSFMCVSIPVAIPHQLSPIDFMHVQSLFLVSNDKSMAKTSKNMLKTAAKLIPNIHGKSIIDNVSHDPNKIIYNFSNYHRTDFDKTLIRGLNFAIPPKKTELFKISTSV